MADPTPVLDATIGGANSNSYVTLAEADAYFAGTAHNSEWGTHHDGYKEAALIQATQWLDLLGWAGKCCASTQRLQWPRKDVTCMCRDAVCTEIPLQVKQATYELAFKFVHNPDAICGGVKGPTTKDGAVKKQQLGDLSIEFFEPTNGSESKVSVSGPTVLQSFPWLVDMLGCWLGSTGSSSRVISRCC